MGDRIAFNTRNIQSKLTDVNCLYEMSMRNVSSKQGSHPDSSAVAEIRLPDAVAERGRPLQRGPRGQGVCRGQLELELGLRRGQQSAKQTGNCKKSSGGKEDRDHFGETVVSAAIGVGQQRGSLQGRPMKFFLRLACIISDRR